MAAHPDPPLTLDVLIETVVSRNPEGDALVHLRDAVLVAQVLDEQADQLISHFVDDARQGGASWTTIGQSLGVTKQAAQQRFVLDDDDVADFRGPLFRRFTPRARKAVGAAREHAQRLAADHVASSHLVLGLLAEKGGIAARALADQGIEFAAAQATFEAPESPAKTPPAFAPETKRALQLSLREALKRGHNYIGTEHLLVGVLADRESSGAALLRELGIDIAAANTYIDKALEDPTRHVVSRVLKRRAR